MKAKFEIKIAKNGEYMFNLFASNGRVIATSETYTALHNCKGGIESVKQNASAPMADLTLGDTAIPHPRYEVFFDRENRFRFRLKASNGEIVCASQGYSAKQSALDGIASIAENAPTAEIVLTEEAK